MSEQYSKYPDLYHMETWSIDLFRCIWYLREGNKSIRQPQFDREIALDAAQNLASALPEIIRKLEAQETP